MPELPRKGKTSATSDPTPGERYFFFEPSRPDAQVELSRSEYDLLEQQLLESPTLSGKLVRISPAPVSPSIIDDPASPAPLHALAKVAVWIDRENLTPHGHCIVKVFLIRPYGMCENGCCFKHQVVYETPMASNWQWRVSKFITQNGYALTLHPLIPEIELHHGDSNA